MNYASSVNFPLDNIFVIDGSRRSSKSNAFFTGFGKNKRVALYDTLVESHTVSELRAILAHEIGHYKKGHILQGMVAGVVQIGIMFYLLSIFLNHQGMFDAFYMEYRSIYAGIVFFTFLYSPFEIMVGMLMQMFSRKNEFEADRYAVETCGDPTSMVEALKKLSTRNLSNLNPHPLFVFLNYSHPPVLRRIEAIGNVKE